MPSILTTLGVGSGIDTTALIDSLVTADASTQRTALTRKTTDLDARISAMAQLKSATTSIASSLAARVSAGNLGVQVASSDSTTLGIARLGVGPQAAFDSNVTVDLLAAGQQLNASKLATGATVGLGTLTIATGTRTTTDTGFSFAAGATPPVAITITAANNTLAGLRDAINASGAGVRASIVSDVDGGSLVLKGATGATSAFSLTAAPADGDTGLARFDYRPDAAALTLTQSAQDAQLHVDGVAIRRASNTVDDVIPGARLTLNTAAPTQAVRIVGQRDGSGASSALSDLADALSALRSLVGSDRQNANSSTGAAAGPLSGDASAASFDSRLVALLSAPAETGGLTLRDCGLSIARDGSIAFDRARLDVLGDTRAADVAALIGGLGTATAGHTTPLSALSTIADTATAGYTTRKTTVTADSAKLDAHSAAYRAQLVAQYAAMETAVAASKAVGSFLTEQIKAWQQTGN